MTSRNCVISKRVEKINGDGEQPIVKERRSACDYSDGEQLL